MLWINLIVGIWLIVAPFLMGYSDITNALWSNLIAGIIVVVIAIYGLSKKRGQVK